MGETFDLISIQIVGNAPFYGSVSISNRSKTFLFVNPIPIHMHIRTQWMDGWIERCFCLEKALNLLLRLTSGMTGTLYRKGLSDSIFFVSIVCLQLMSILYWTASQTLSVRPSIVWQCFEPGHIHEKGAASVLLFSCCCLACAQSIVEKRKSLIEMESISTRLVK